MELSEVRIWEELSAMSLEIGALKSRLSSLESVERLLVPEQSSESSFQSPHAEGPAVPS